MILQWTENRPPCAGCPYDHCIAKTPFGRFLITWKSWKEYDSPTVDGTPWDDSCYESDKDLFDPWCAVFDSVDAAKVACQQAMSERLALCVQPCTGSNEPDQPDSRYTTPTPGAPTDAQ